MHILMSFPNPEQAERAIKLLQRVCMSLDGKLLAE